MSDAVKLSTFPKTRAEALTMLYLEQQDLTSITPEELARKYVEVKSTIEKSLSSETKNQWNF